MPLTPRHLATLRAALQFWKEETLPYGLEVMQPYFESTVVEPLTLEEIMALDQHLKCGLRYVIYDLKQEQINSKTLFDDVDQAQEAASGLSVGTVLLDLLAT